ncbi:hypothetical protein TNCV_633461 [Trichonephila clavipes]|nr:hypothetical protein TNCV_633461 [Trichonephila clavipes]
MGLSRKKEIEKSCPRLYLGSPKSFKDWKMLIYVVKSSSRSFCRAWERVIIGRDDSDRLGLGSNPGEEMDVCKCIVPSQHGGTSNSRRAASPLVRPSISCTWYGDVVYRSCDGLCLMNQWSWDQDEGCRV